MPDSPENAPKKADLPPAAEQELIARKSAAPEQESDAQDQPAKHEPGVDGTAISVVGLGASAGGVQVLQEFFGGMPNDTGLAFVVVIHLDPEHESTLPQILQAKTRMPVVQVREEVRVEPNHVYVIPPNKHLAMHDSMLGLIDVQQSRGRRVAIDLFFRTLAEQYGQKSLGIVLSGSDSDGTIGLKHIKAQGGVTIAQDPAEAQFDAMPRFAIETGMVDWILPVAEMPKRLQKFVENEVAMILPPEEDGETAPGLVDLAPCGPGGPLVSKKTDDPADETALYSVLTFLRAQTGHDFLHYKRATVLRRIARRLQVNGLEDVPSYLDFLQAHPTEARLLLDDLLIGVTHFFRDQGAFRALESHVPQLFAGKRPNEQVRAWVAGCATGEEAYSLAMLLCEQAERLDRPPQIQVFATDLDEDSIRAAREGTYPETIEVDVSQKRLRRFFFNYHGRHRVKKELRELVLFADHDLLRDAPFSRLDLISCRNLLIYLKPDAQHRVLDILHFALRPGGLLFLGGSENVDESHAIFSPLDRHHHIYVRRSAPRVPVVSLMPRPRLPKAPDVPVLPLASPPLQGDFRSEGDVVSNAQQRLHSLAHLHVTMLEKYAPPSVIVDENYDVLHMSPSAGEFLRFSGGEPSANILRLADDQLRVELRSALFRAAQESQNVSIARVRTSRDSEERFIRLHVRPARTAGSDGERVFLVVFEDLHLTDAQRAAETLPPNDGGAARHLEEELRQVRSQLSATVEQYETAAEELKASNEELQAMNEEMRSATEELETSKEELQSINEELTTVNHELKSNLEELSRSNSDLQNLMASTDIATLFLDRQLRIKRFTPRTTELFNLIASDIGRPLSDITAKINYAELTTDARRVLDDLVKVQREVQANGNWFIARLSPYRTLDEKIDGVVLAFVDITERKKVEDKLRINEQRLQRMINVPQVGVITLDFGGALLHANDAFIEMLGYSRAEFDARRWTWRDFTPEKDVPASEQVMRDLRETGQGGPYEKECRCKDGSYLRFMFVGADLDDGTIVEYAVDVTARDRAEKAFRESQAQLTAAFEALPSGVGFIDSNGRLLFSNGQMQQYLPNGMAPSRDETQSGRWRAWHADGRPYALEDFPGNRALRGERILPGLEMLHTREDGREVWTLVSAVPVRDGENKVAGVAVVVTDIDKVKRADQALHESEEQFRRAIEEAPIPVIMHAEDGNVLQVSRTWSQLTGYTLSDVPTFDAWLTSAYGEGADEVRDYVHSLFEGARQSIAMDFPVRTRSGEQRYWSFSASSPGTLRDGRRFIVGMAVDITDRITAEAALRETDERLQLLVEGARDYAMFLLSPENKITYWSAGAERIFGWAAKEAEGQPGHLIFTPEDRKAGRVEKEIGITRDEGRAPDRRYHLRKDGSRFWADGVLMRLDDEQGQIRGYAKIARDATDQKLAEEELRHARDELEQRVLERTADLTGSNVRLQNEIDTRQQLERDLLEISERERRRIGQDLHDVVCQELTATALFLKSSSNNAPDPSSAAQLNEAAQVVNRNVALARDLARGYQPVMVASGGLTGALRSLCQRTNEHLQFTCELKLPKAVRVPDETIALNLFRIAQEAVTNAIRHSGGTSIKVCLEREGKTIRLVIEDNGRGLRPSKKSKGLGLHIMKYRANVIGGTLHFAQAKGGGTRIVCETPVKK